MIEKSIPILVFFLMFIIGAHLKYADIRALIKQPVVLFIATLGQTIILPFIAWLLIVIIEPSQATAVGLLLVSFCPGGAVSNIYSFFAGVNVAFSITLTTLNSLLSILFLPFFLSYLLPSLIPVTLEFNELIKMQSTQLTVFLLCPIILGFLLSINQSRLINKIMPTLERLGALALLLLLVAIFVQFNDGIAEQFSNIVLLALLFTIISMMIARFICYLLSLNKEDSGALIIEFPVRNLPLTAVIAISVLNNNEYLLFAAVFFAVQTPVMLFTIFRYRFKNQVNS